MNELQKKLEAILFYKNEAVSKSDIANFLSIGEQEVDSLIESLSSSYDDRGFVVVKEGDMVTFGTSPDLSDFIENVRKDELSKDIGKAGLETLSIILYKGPISRREIDYIRGVNSGSMLRNLMIRGLVERVDESSNRGYSYKATLKLLEHLGLSRREDLPGYFEAIEQIKEFEKTKNDEV